MTNIAVAEPSTIQTTRGPDPIGWARKLLTLVVGGVILAWCVRYLTTSFEWRQALTILGRADPFLFFSMGIGTLLTYGVLRTLRWRLMLGAICGKADPTDLYFATVVSLGLGLITPGQSGEAIKVELLKRHGQVGRLSGYGSFVVERIIDLLVLLGFAELGLLTGAPLVPWQRSLGLALPVVMAGLALGWVILVRLRPDGAKGRGWSRLGASAGSPKDLLPIVALTLGSWLLVGLGWWASLASVGLRTVPQETMTLVAVVALGRALSLLPGGLGLQEVLASELLVRMGHEVPVAQAGALIIRCYSMLFVLISLAHLPVWRWARRTRTPGAVAGDAEPPDTQRADRDCARPEPVPSPAPIPDQI
jgi:uncharacterized membrane protein YbhN (UPF0104 family)